MGFPALNLPGDVVDVLEQGEISPDEVVLPGRADGLQLSCDAAGRPLRAADEADARLDGVPGELLHGGLADAAGATDKDGDEPRRQALGDERVRRPHLLERHHLGELATLPLWGVCSLAQPRLTGQHRGQGGRPGLIQLDKSTAVTRLSHCSMCKLEGEESEADGGSARGWVDRESRRRQRRAWGSGHD